MRRSFEDYFFDNMWWLILVAGTLMIGLADFSRVTSQDTKCIGGYLFTNPIGKNSSSVQILDESGSGIRCGK